MKMRNNANLKFNGQTAWVHVFKSMITSGDFARLSGNDIKVYMSIKFYVNWKTGRSYPGQRRLATETGLAARTIQRSIKKLCSFGYLKVHKIGRRNEYTLVEQIEFQDQKTNEIAVAKFDYLPIKTPEICSDLAEFKARGETCDGSNVKIEIGNINIILDGLSPKLRESLLRMKEFVIGDPSDGC